MQGTQRRHRRGAHTRLPLLQYEPENQRFQGNENKGKGKQPATPHVDLTRFKKSV